MAGLCLIRRSILGCAVSAAVFAADQTPPMLKFLDFTPRSVTTSVDKTISVDFEATDDDSGVIHFEISLVDPTGFFHQSASLDSKPARSLRAQLQVAITPFMASGNWEVSSVCLTDLAGNTTILQTADLSAKGFPVALKVASANDVTGPKLESLRVSPPNIDTSSGASTVELSYVATDDLSGVGYLEVALTSPLGSLVHGSAKIIPARKVSDTMILTFPKSSEPGRWRLTSAFLADANGNTTVLGRTELTQMGLAAEVNVKSMQDTSPPKLTMMRILPDRIGAVRSDSTAKIAFSASDDLSGVESVEIACSSPSGAVTQHGKSTFPPERAVTGTIEIALPAGSERGQWKISVLITDASGNTSLLEAKDLARMNLQSSLRVGLD
jgi:hypothetical protein